jgi:hypothetical protein
MTDYLGFYIDVLEKPAPPELSSTHRVVHISCYERGSKLCCRLDELTLIDMGSDAPVARVCTNRRNPYVQGVAVYHLPARSCDLDSAFSSRDAEPPEETYLVRVVGHLDMRLQRGIRRLTKDTGYRPPASPAEGAVAVTYADRIQQLETQLRRSRDDGANALCEAARLRRAVALAEEALAASSRRTTELEEENWRLRQELAAEVKKRKAAECQLAAAGRNIARARRQSV